MLDKIGDRVPRHFRSKVSFLNEKEKSLDCFKGVTQQLVLFLYIFRGFFFKQGKKDLSFSLIKNKKVCPVINHKQNRYNKVG
jgi:hypothetical protein